MESLKAGNYVAPGICVYDNVLDDPQKYIDLALTLDGWKDAQIYDHDHDAPGRVADKQNVDKNMRNNKILNMPADFSSPLEWYELTRLIWKYSDAYATENGFGFESMEALAMLHYEKGAGFYNPHIDNADANPRVAAALLYLNDVEEGGETHFVNFNLSVKPKAGTLVLFPGNYPYLHGAKTPLSGDKFALVTWLNPIRYKPESPFIIN